MGWNVQQNDDSTVRLISTEDEGDTPAEMEVGRGSTDTDITYVALRNDTGVKCYIYPNAAGNGIVVSTTKP